MTTIGLTGKNASGKGAVAKILEKQGFIYHSLSDAIREELRREKKETSRENLIKKGNELRQKFGPPVLAVKIKKLIKGDKNIVDSIRNPYEAKELRKLPDFTLIGIDAPVETRFERIKKRGRIGDSKTVKELKEHESKENIDNPVNQQLNKTFEMADIVVINGGSIENLKGKILNIISKLR